MSESGAELRGKNGSALGVFFPVIGFHHVHGGGMKITSSDIIRMNESVLLNSIYVELDWKKIEKLVFEKHRLHLLNDMEYKRGDIVVHDNQVAYKLDFDFKADLSIIVDSDGECIAIEVSTQEMSPPAEIFSSRKSENVNFVERSGIASEIAEMLSQINDDGGSE